MSEATFAVLGPLETRGRRTPIQLGGSKPRAILGTLLLQPGGFVSVDVLTEVLWPGRPPSSAVANIRTYVNGLRKVLTAGGVGGDCVRTEPLGYRLVAPDQEVDAVVFDHLLKQARTQRAAGDDQSALDSCEQALGLWRGGVLEDLAPSVVWDPIVVRLEELRASAAEERLDLQLRLGHYETLVAELRSRLAGDPLREDLWRILVHALHQTGRAGEARAAYAEAVGVLAVELGAEPGKALRAAGELVGIRATEFRDNQSRHTSMPICQLPLDTPDFTGRETIVSSLEQLLRSADRSPTVAVLFGAPGIGKTTLAVHLAHRVRDAFPDGQLYVEMSGSSDVCREPADVLAELLRGLGVPEAAIPRNLPERAALFRSWMARRRMLLVLDDAAGSGQTLPLLPGAGGSAVLVTSRLRMPDMPGRHHEVNVFERQDARRLFAALVGKDRVAAAQEDTDRVLAACGSLPLAVRIAGARLANHPGLTIAGLADSLATDGKRLDQLRAGGLEVRASVTPSYQRLSASAATAFRALGQLPRAAAPSWVIAVATGQGAAAQEDVEALLAENLLTFAGVDVLGQPRYRLHSLLHDYARELAKADPPRQRRARQERHVRALTELARSANRHMPIRFLGVVGGSESLNPATEAARLAARNDPVAWFEAERDMLVTSVESTMRLGLTPDAAALAVELAGFFDLRGYYQDWQRTHQVVLDAYRDSSDHASASLLRNIGQLHLYQDQYADALTAFEQSRDSFCAMGDSAAAGFAAVGSGAVRRVLGNLDAAMADFTAALRSFEESSDLHGQSAARNAIASVWLERRQPDQAGSWLRTALALSIEVGDRHREAQVRRRVAVLHDMQGDAARAQLELETALTAFDDLGDTHCAAYVQQAIGERWLRQNRPTVASPLLTDALSTQKHLGDRRAEASVASLLGELHQSTGKTRVAVRYYHRSKSIWRQLAQSDQVAEIDARLRKLR